MQQILRTLSTAAFGLVLMLTVLMPSPAEADAYLKIAGIKGESMDEGHKDQIEVLSWSLGESHPTTSTVTSAAARATTGSGAVDPAPAAASGKRQYNPITFTKRIDKASPMLQKANADHQVFPSMTLSLPNPNGTSNSYLVYELKEVIVSSYQTSAGQGGDAPTESVTLNYAKIKQVKSDATDSTGKAVDQN